jgi:tetratricopeptide (TPR) repeat protein
MDLSSTRPVPRIINVPVLSVLIIFILISPVRAVFSQDHLKRSTDLLTQGDLVGAEKEANLALADRSNRAVAYAILGAIRLQQNKYVESHLLLEKALRLKPDLLGARLNLGLLYELQGNNSLARETYRQVLKADPQNFNARFFLSRVESASGKYASSLKIANPIVQDLKASPEGIRLLTTAYLKVGDTGKAKDMVAAWKELSDVLPEQSLGFAHVLAGAGLTQEAIEILEKVKRSDKFPFSVPFTLAGYYLVEKKPAQASANYELALNLNENCVDCCRFIAMIARQQKELEKALAYLIRARRLQPENPDLLLNFGRVCLEMDLHDDAIKALTRANELRPDNEETLYALGAAYVSKLKYDEAYSLFQKLAQRHPNDPVLNYALGSVLYLQVKFDQAESYLNKSIRLKPEQLAAYYYLGLVAERKGEGDRAIKIFRGILERYPNHAATCEALGTVLLKEKRYAEAQPVLEKAVTLNPRSAKARYQLGMLLGRIGKTEEASKVLETAKRLIADERAESSIELHLLMTPDSP